MSDKKQPIDEEQLGKEIRQYIRDNLETQIIELDNGGFEIVTVWKGEPLDDS